MAYYNTLEENFYEYLRMKVEERLCDGAKWSECQDLTNCIYIPLDPYIREEIAEATKDCYMEEEEYTELFQKARQIAVTSFINWHPDRLDSEAFVFLQPCPPHYPKGNRKKSKGNRAARKETVVEGFCGKRHRNKKF